LNVVLIDGRNRSPYGQSIPKAARLQAPRGLSVWENTPSDNPGWPISELLRGITDKQARVVHRIDDYVRAFEGSAWRAKALLHVGGESVVLELTDSAILKITGKMILEAEMGRRGFDIPILRRGCWFDIHWFIQPKAVTPVSIEERNRLREELKDYGYRMCDP
jgi:hypothetical protein